MSGRCVHNRLVLNGVCQDCGGKFTQRELVQLLGYEVDRLRGRLEAAEALAEAARVAIVVLSALDTLRHIDPSFPALDGLVHALAAFRSTPRAVPRVDAETQRPKPGPSIAVGQEQEPISHEVTGRGDRPAHGEATPTPERCRCECHAETVSCPHCLGYSCDVCGDTKKVRPLRYIDGVCEELPEEPCRKCAGGVAAPPAGGRDYTAEYERLAAEFRHQTGLMAPGKDRPAAMGESHLTDEELRKCWDEWRKARAGRGGRDT